MKKKILAIDNSKAIRFLLQTVLSKDYQVVTAPDGCSAMHWLSKKNIPDLIIADPQLSDMQDWELIEQLVTSELYNQIPVLVLTSLNAEEAEAKGIELGVMGCFTKPFNPIELLETVKMICNTPKVDGFILQHTPNMVN